MTTILLLPALGNAVGFIVRARRWARTGSGFSALVAGAHLTMGLLLTSAALAL